jgi:surface protein
MFLWCVGRRKVLWSGYILLLFLRVDCECNRPSFLATVFSGAIAFNGDLSLWDVAKVTEMNGSKSVRILTNGLTWRELMLLGLEGSVGGLGWWWWWDVMMVERWRWSMRDVECTLSWPIVTTHVVCDKRWYSYEISSWYFMLFDRCEISFWDYTPFGPSPKHGCFKWSSLWYFMLLLPETLMRLHSLW